MNTSTATTVPASNTEGGTAIGYFVLEPDGGERLRFLGASTMRFKLDTAANADVAFYEYVSEPGVSGPPQHVHHAHDETFYVVDGTYEFVVGADGALLPPGSFLFIPRGTPHTFRNAGEDLGRIVGTFNPARFANYFRELAAIIADTGVAPDRDTWAALYGRYDTTFYAGS
jgi:mannose-6-phosphate isomerase-like protein (cupin superfamily)